MPSLYRKVSVFSSRSSVSTISTPGFKNASSRKRFARTSNLNSVVIVKMSGSGLKVMSVPVPRDLPTTVSFCVVTPRENSME